MARAKEVRIRVDVDAGKYIEGFFPVYHLQATFSNGKTRKEKYVYVAEPYESWEAALAKGKSILLPVKLRLKREWELRARKVFVESGEVVQAGVV